MEPCPGALRGSCGGRTGGVLFLRLLESEAAPKCLLSPRDRTLSMTGCWRGGFVVRRGWYAWCWLDASVKAVVEGHGRVEHGDGGLDMVGVSWLWI